MGGQATTWAVPRSTSRHRHHLSCCFRWWSLRRSSLADLLEKLWFLLMDREAKTANLRRTSRSRQVPELSHSAKMPGIGHACKSERLCSKAGRHEQQQAARKQHRPGSSRPQFRLTCWSGWLPRNCGVVAGGAGTHNAAIWSKTQ